MAWNLTAEFTETCSCNMLCPCWYGVKELMVMDKGWCASAWLLRVQQGSANGVDLSGRTLAIALDWPGPTLYDGNGTARLYIDDAASGDQCRELEAIFQGTKGALWRSWLTAAARRFYSRIWSGFVTNFELHREGTKCR